MFGNERVTDLLHLAIDVVSMFTLFSYVWCYLVALELEQKWSSSRNARNMCSSCSRFISRTVSVGSRRRQISGSRNLVVTAFFRATAEELSRESVVLRGPHYSAIPRGNLVKSDFFRKCVLKWVS